MASASTSLSGRIRGSRDLAAITHTANVFNLLVVHPGVAASTLPEAIALAKRHPGRLTLGSTGNGQSNHLSGEMLRTMAGDRYRPRAMRRSTSLTELRAGHVSMMFVDLLSDLLHVGADKLRALAATG